MATFSPCRGFALLLLLLCPQFLTASADDLVIDTEGGTVQGKLIPSLGDNIRAFLGIPYGKPPVGELRFNPPLPAESWEGVWDATKYSDSCHQIPDDAFPGRSMFTRMGTRPTCVVYCVVSTHQCQKHTRAKLPRRNLMLPVISLEGQTMSVSCKE